MLPDNLSVGGYLHLGGCTGLTELPEGLKVGGDLHLGGCTGLTELPEGLKVGGDLYLSKDLNEQVIKDADRLKEEGKIAEEITGFQDIKKQSVLSSSISKIRNFFKSSLK
jgi:hypothetical protein